jgi:hypothetical protein
VAPVLVTVKVKSVVPGRSPSAWVTSSIVITGAASSLVIVPVPVPVAPIVAFVASDSVTVKVSLFSKTVSSQSWTVIVLVVSPGAKVSVSESDR